LGSPEEQVAYFEPIVEENPEDIDAWKALAEAYDDLGQRAKLKEARVKIYELDPTFESALDLAEFAQSNANYAEADKYFKEALDLAEDESVKRDIYLDLADANISLRRLSQAKNYVQQAIKIDPEHGLSYIKMATVYGEAITQCTEDRSLEPQDRVVYWVVIDYLNKAKQMDSSVTNTVNSQLSQYKAVTPTTEDKFMTLNFEDGDQVKVNGSLNECYSFINETTTVR